MNEQVFRALENRGTVVTATRRLARSLRREYNILQQTCGASAWDAPTILSWSAWMVDLWEQFLYSNPNPPIRLSPWQELVLWERVIRESAESCELLQIKATATAAQEAWSLANEWQLNLSLIDKLGNEDGRAFAVWARRFREICNAEHWLEHARVADWLRNGLKTLHLPPILLPAGFDEFTPQQQEFLKACSNAGCRIDTFKSAGSQPKNNGVRVALLDPEQEIAAAARWARALLENGASGSIGVVITDLTARRNTADRIFRTILEPATQLPGGYEPSKLFNISAGNPLSSHPMIRSAFDILSLSREGAEWNQVSTLIRRPYMGGADTEYTARALMDARIRQDSDLRVSFSRLRHMCHGVPPCPLLDRMLGAWAHVSEQAPARQTSGQWGRTFSAMLKAAGWPGERPLNSAEYQTIQAWTEVLSQFAATDIVGGAIRLHDAVALLGRIAQETMFQPETEHAAVQILGTLEASGLAFDHLWVAGLDDEAWPRSPNPNPFLPIRAQREAGLPRCSPKRELDFAALVTERLLASSSDVVLSYAIRKEDQELAPSPLISMIPETVPSALNLWGGPTFVELIRQSRSVETLIDEQGPALGEAARQRGGTKVFQYQSICPFRAFAELRLGAEKLESPAPGLDARQRGILVHASLEEIWKQLRSHQALCAGADIPKKIQDAVQTAVTRFEQERGAPIPPRFAALERDRLERLVAEWLELEKQRAPFEVIQPEGEAYVEVSGIHCKVKIDRIDRLPDGRELIIDYKTGKASPGDWDTDRPEEPQLPLYSTVHSRPLAGVLFGQVKAGELRFLGLADPGLTIPGRTVHETDLAAQIKEWRAVLEQLGSEFRAGRAAAAPKDPNKQCPRCALSCLCRIADAGNGYHEEESRS